MNIQSIIKWAIILASTIILAACSMTVTQQPPPATSDIAQTLDALRTEVAIKATTEFASQASPTPLPPTATLAPSATTLPSDTPVPSNTPVPQATATNTRIPFTRTPAYTATPKNLNCSITKTTPNGDRMAAHTDFDARWTVKNTGTDTWTKESFDYKYVSGQKMQKYNDAYDFKTDVASDDTIDIIVDMIAPDKTGSYSATWAIMKGSTRVCTMTVNIIVK
jgi:hypothetical protein